MLQKKAILCLATVVFMLLGLDTELYAQEESQRPDSSMRQLQLQEIAVVAQRLEVPEASLHAIETLDADSLSLSAEADLATGLAQLPGVAVRSIGIGQAKPVMRGHAGSRILTLENGIAQEDQQWSMDHGLAMSAQNGGQWRLIRGPATLLYGSGAIGGVLLHQQEAPNTLQKVQVESQTRYHSVNDLIGQQASAAYGGRKWGLEAGGAYQRFGDFRVPADSFNYNRFILPIEDERLNNTAGQSQSAFANYRQQMGDRVTAHFYVSHFQQEGGFFPGALGRPGFYNLGESKDTWDMDLPRFDIQHQKVQGRLRWMAPKGYHRLHLGYQRNHRRELSDPAAHGQPRSRFGNLANELQLHTATANWRFQHDGRGPWRWQYGAQTQIRENQQDGFEFFIPGYSSWKGAAFGMATYQLNAQHQFQAGLRFGAMRYAIEADSVLRPQSSQNERQYVQRSWRAQPEFVAPAVQLAWQYQPEETNWQLLSQLGHTYRFPNIAELGANGVHHGTFIHEYGSAALDPERAWQLDLHFDWQDGPWSFGLAPYSYYFSNYLYLNPTSRLSRIPGGGQRFAYTQHRVWQGGGEATAAYRSPYWSLSVSGEATYLRNLDTRLPVPFVPPPSLRLSGQYRPFFLRDMNLQLSSVYTSAQNRVARAEFGRQTPSFLNFDADMAYTFSWGRKHALEARLGVHNLLDATYFQHLSRYRLINIPEPGRNIRLSLSYRLSQ